MTAQGGCDVEENNLGMACRVCGVVDDKHGEYLLDPEGDDLEWLHYRCREEDARRRGGRD